jgi:hypothetical protein
MIIAGVACHCFYFELQISHNIMFRYPPTHHCPTTTQAPDPAPSLLAAVEQQAELGAVSAQSVKLAAELAEYKAESRAIKSQDITIRKQVCIV